MAGAVINNVLYVAGGLGAAGVLATVEAYDPASNTWTAKAPLPAPTLQLGAGVTNGTLYFVGGASENQSVGTTLTYDPASNSWSTKTSIAPARAQHSVVGLGGGLYAVGGSLFGVGISGDMQVYDPGSARWTSRQPMPTPRVGFGLDAANGSLYAIGGLKDSATTNVILGAVEAYDPANNSWIAKAALPTPRVALSIVTMGGRIYALGGQTGSLTRTIVGTNEMYRP
jgi:N-acetylneuraminic acid mutarotase